MLEINNTTRQKINLSEIQALAKKFWRVYPSVNREVSLAIVGDARMKRLNEQYRGQNKTTDVLSFPGVNEIVINIQEVKRVGKYREMFKELGLDSRRAATTRYILYFLVVHGLLHLLGYNDNTEPKRQEMLRRGKEFLNQCF